MCQTEDCTNIRLNESGKNYVFKLKCLLFLVVLIAIANIAIAKFNEFQSNLMLVILILIYIVCLNYIIGVFLIISLIFSLIQVFIFFGLKLQNYYAEIPEIDAKSKRNALYVINSFSLIVYIAITVYTYWLTEEVFDISKNSQNQYLALNNAGDMETGQNREPTNQNQNGNNFRAFSGQGTRLED